MNGLLTSVVAPDGLPITRCSCGSAGTLTVSEIDAVAVRHLGIGNRNRTDFSCRPKSCRINRRVIGKNIIARRDVAVRAVVEKHLRRAAADTAQIAVTVIPVLSGFVAGLTETFRSVESPALTSFGIAEPVAR